MVPFTDAARLILLPIWNLELAVHWTATEMRALDLRPGLASITAPALVLAGTDDPQYPLTSIEEVIEGIPDVRVARFPGARHSVFRDAPASLETVRGFVG
jgi:pimeloyl-ACP methyl ester carboxylesterase